MSGVDAVLPWWSSAQAARRLAADTVRPRVAATIAELERLYAEDPARRKHQNPAVPVPVLRFFDEVVERGSDAELFFVILAYMLVDEPWRRDCAGVSDSAWRRIEPLLVPPSSDSSSLSDDPASSSGSAPSDDSSQPSDSARSGDPATGLQLDLGHGDELSQLVHRARDLLLSSCCGDAVPGQHDAGGVQRVQQPAAGFELLGAPDTPL